MLSIVEDSCGVHDSLITPCSLRAFQIVVANEDYHASCSENLGLALSKFGISDDEIASTFNIFMNVKIRPDVRVVIDKSVAKLRAQIVFPAQMDVIVGLAPYAHEESNGGKYKPISFAISEKA